MRKSKLKQEKIIKRKSQSLKEQFSDFVKFYASNFDFLNDQN
jgi:hypothetical protein